MKILFYYRGAENFGIEYLSAVLKKEGHETELLYDPGYDDNFYFKAKILSYLPVKRQLIKIADNFKPDMLAFSSTSNLYPYVLEMAKILKKRYPVFSVIGGIHATVVPHYILKEDCFDAVCIGEGEETLVELANNLQNKKDIIGIKNLWVKRNGEIIENPVRNPADINSLPRPDKELFYKYGAFWKCLAYMAGRGCPYNCSFCVNSTLRDLYNSGKFIRLKNVETVINELVYFKERFRSDYIDFQDDILVYNKDWFRNFCESYKEKVNLKYQCNIHSKCIDDTTGRLLKESNCDSVCLGIQTGSEVIRKKILNRFESNKEIIETVKIMKKNGIKVVAEVIFGLPDETDANMLKTAEKIFDLNPDNVSTFLFYPFIKTKIEKELRKKGLITPENQRNLKKGLFSYHTEILIHQPYSNMAKNLALLLPIILKAPFINKLPVLKYFCRLNHRHPVFRIFNIISLPFMNMFQFKERLLNYIYSFCRLFIKKG